MCRMLLKCEFVRKKIALKKKKKKRKECEYGSNDQMILTHDPKNKNNNDLVQKIKYQKNKMKIIKIQKIINRK